MPLRKAQPGEETRLETVVSREPFFNLFLISNLREGLSADVVVWVQDGVGVLMRRHGYWSVDPGPDPAAFDFAEAAAVMDVHPSELVRGMTGRPEAVEPLVARLRNHRGQVYRQTFAVLRRRPAPVSCPGTPRPARPEDVETLAAIYADAGELSRPRHAVERMLPSAWVWEVDGQIVSAAGVAARTPQAAMIGAVYTPPAYRRKGYATALVRALSVRLLDEGVTPCLFYHNPEAGRIYRRLGYEEHGPWMMVKFGPSEWSRG